jgi:hypothetical protein
MRICTTLMAFGLLLSVAASHAAEPAPTAGPEQLKSAAWWRQQAVKYVRQIGDDKSRGQACYDLTYPLTRAGDLDGTLALTESIDNPQLRVYAIDFLAREYKRRGDDKSCRRLLQQAEEVALASNSNSEHSHLIRTYLEFGQPAEAISLAERISREFHRNCAFQDIAATLAKQGKLEMAHDVVKQHVPPVWEESCLSCMANACADELRIDEALKLGKRLVKPELKDRVYQHLVAALINAKRTAEAGQYADRIADAKLQSIARGQIARALASNEGVDALRARLKRAAVRDEKLAIYDLLFAKLIDAGDVTAAEATIESMVKTIEASPRDAESSKFGRFDDSAAVAMVRAKYIAVAALLAKKGDHEVSQLRLAVARTAVTEMSDETGIGKAMLLSQLVHGQIALGDFQGAKAVLDRLEKGFHRSSLAGPVAAGLIRSGDVKSGLEVAKMITPSSGSGSAIGQVASALISAGEFEAAKTLLQKVGDSRDEVEAFRAVGGSMAQAGRLAELKQWIGELKSDTARAYLCLGVAETLQRPKK